MKKLPSLTPCVIAWLLVGLGCESQGPRTASVEEPTYPFIDATRSTGLDFVHDNGATDALYMPEILGAGCAFLDYDGDGDDDLHLVQGGSLDPQTFQPTRDASDRLLRNDRLGAGFGPGLAWVDVTVSSGLRADGYGMGVAVADVNDDGLPDIFLAQLGPDELWLSTGDGGYQRAPGALGFADQSWSLGAAFFDADLDADLDLFVTRYIEHDAALHRTCRADDGSPDYCKPASFPALADRLYLNLGEASFDDYSSALGIDSLRAPGMGLAIRDWNGDGRPDVFVANDGLENHLWLGGAGRFTESALEFGVALNAQGAREASMGTTVADFDRDRDLDLFLTHLSGETHTLYTAETGGFFLDSTASQGLAQPTRALTGFGSIALDADADGWLDLAVANGSVRRSHPMAGATPGHPLAQPLLFLRGSAHGFQETAPFRGSEDPASWRAGRGLCSADVDGDLATDFVVTNNGAEARLYTGAPERDRLISLRFSRVSEAARLASTLEVVSDGSYRVFDLGRHGSYASSSSIDRQVGLGSTQRTEVCIHRTDLPRRCWRGLEPARSYELIY